MDLITILDRFIDSIKDRNPKGAAKLVDMRPLLFESTSHAPKIYEAMAEATTKLRKKETFKELIDKGIEAVERKGEPEFDFIPEPDDEEVESVDFHEDSASPSWNDRSTYHDIWEDDEYVPDDPMETRGRVNPPVDLSRYPELPGLEDNRKVMGIDVAAYGSDRTVFVIRHGCHVVDVQRYSTRDVMELVGLVVRTVDEIELDEIVVDSSGGYGTGLISRLEELGVDEKATITPVIFNEKPRNSELRVKNQKAEMYYLLKERFREGNITLPMDKEAIEDIAYTAYKYSSDGGVLDIVPKKEIRKKLGRSPDAGDAIALSFYDMEGIEIY